MARREGLATARALRAIGVNVDLAPVADVASAPGHWLGTRAYSDDPGVAASAACGFAAGLRNGGELPVLKHFPGLGRADANTDLQPTVVKAPLRELRRDQQAFPASASRA